MIVPKFVLCCSIIAFASVATYTQELRGGRSTDSMTLSSRFNSGDAAAAYALANRYVSGFGVAPDYGVAAQLYQVAADGGNRDAQLAAGHCYAHGLGVTKDDVQALRYFRMAAEQGHAVAAFNVGLMYESGRGTS